MTENSSRKPDNLLMLFDKMDKLRNEHEVAMLANDSKLASMLLNQIIELAVVIDRTKLNQGRQ